MQTTDTATLEAGPALNELISERIFGVKVTPHCTGVLKTRIWNDPLVHCDDCGLEQPWNTPTLQIGGLHNRVPPYSTDIEAAWSIVEHLCADGLRVFRASGPIAGYRFGFWPGYLSYNRREDMAEADTMALAICRAALAFVAQADASAAGIGGQDA